MASEIEINQLCRLCLVKEQVNVPIFEEEGDLGQIFLKISACLPVKISRDDSLPKKICDSCSCKLDVVYQFWNTSANSEKQLLKWLNQLGVVNTMTSANKKNSDSQMAHSINAETVINLKQEVVELAEHEDDDNMTTEEMDDSNDSENYMLQQQHIPYENFSFQDGFPNEEPSHAVASSTVTSKTVNTRPKRKRRATTKALQSQLDSDDEDDSLLRGKITKTEEQSDSGEDPEPTAFVGLPSTSTDDQPGPSGINKGNSEAPWKSNLIIANVYSLANGKTKNENKFKPGTKITNLRSNSVYQNEIVTYDRKEVKLNIPEFNKLYQYRRIHDDDPVFKCLNCSSRFVSLRNFASHHYGNHLGRKAMYFCSICKQACGLEGDHEHHPCSVCGAYFLDKDELQEHSEIMHRMRPSGYHCKYCKKTFSTTIARGNHIKVQHGASLQFEKQQASIFKGIPKHHDCSVCGAYFLNKKEVEKHTKTVHVKKKLNELTCKYCKKSFSTAVAVSNHIKFEHTSFLQFEKQKAK